MNEFDRAIKVAKKRHFLFNLTTGILLTCAIVLAIIYFAFTKATVFIVKPDEISTSYQVKIEQGVGFMLSDTLYGFSDEISLQFSAKEFAPETRLIGPNDAQLQTIYLKPLPAQIALTLEIDKLSAGQEPLANSAQLDKTQWRINAKLVHVGHEFKQTLPPGDYQLSVVNPYYQPLEKNLSLKRAQVLTQSLVLNNFTRALEINSSPQGVSVFIDGEKLGETPFSTNKAGGEYQLEIQGEDYQSINETLAIRYQDKEVKRHYHLKKKNGFLAIKVNPTGGILLIDGRTEPVASAGEVNAKVEVNAKEEIEVRYSKRGYQSIVKTVTALPEQTLALNLELEALLGQIEITAQTEDGLSSQTSSLQKQAIEVWVNKKFVGNAPITMTLPAIEQQITLRKSGYRAQSQTILPVANTKQVFHFNLLTEYQARRQEGKPTVAQQLGIQLLSFKPDQVIMGSQENEAGRRRNEFLRIVKFTKPLLVSQHEITEAQFARFKNTASQSNLPVVNVSWLEAIEFCNWLSEQEGLPVFYQIKQGRYVGVNHSAKGYRLPTEAEWEWLARKSQRKKQTLFVWGDEQKPPKKTQNLSDETVRDDRTFYVKDYDDGYAKKAPVGSLKAEPNGLYDLGGNVSEWVHDSYTNKPPRKLETLTDYMGPKGTGKSNGHVVKGANYQTSRLTELRAAYREPSSKASDTIGFRIVRNK